MEELQELESSELGTKEYWDKSYNREIKNYLSHGDCGEIWFDESSQFRVIKWISNNEIESSDKIIDLGTGNGMMLIELAREEFTNLTGVDYSEAGIELAKKIAANENFPQIQYKVVDLLADDVVSDLGTFKVVHDKGTYDAVSLMENPKEKREKYIKTVASLMTEDSFFIITSCNFTEDELMLAFESSFEKHALIPTQTFRFGGKIGSVTTSLVLRKRK